MKAEVRALKEKYGMGLKGLWEKHAKQNGVKLATFEYRMRNGFSLEEASKNQYAKKFERPEHFTNEWYKQQRILGKSNYEIAQSLYVSVDILYRWKREIEPKVISLWEKHRVQAEKNGVSYHMFWDRTKKGIDPKMAIAMGRKDNLLTKEWYEEAEKTGISRGTMKYRVYRLKMTPEQAINAG